LDHINRRLCNNFDWRGLDDGEITSALAGTGYFLYAEETPPATDAWLFVSFLSVR
jgi:hypothetical protein